MKKGSSGNEEKEDRPDRRHLWNRYPTRDNVYNLQKRTAETTGAGERDRHANGSDGADGLCADTASCKEEEAQAEKKEAAT